MSIPGPILMFGKDALLLQTRAQVLQAAGFVLTSVTCLRTLEDAIAEGGWRLLILCHSLSELECRTAVSFTASYASGIPVLTLQAGPSACAIASAEALDILNGPKKLIAKVHSLLQPFFNSNTQSDRGEQHVTARR